MNKGALLLTAALITVAAPALAQAPNAGTVDEGTVFVGAPLTALLSFKSDDTSVKFSFLRRNSASRLYWGFDAAAKAASGGTGNLLKTGDITPGGKLAFKVGLTDLITEPKGSDIDWLYVQLQHDVSETLLFSPDAAYADQINKDTFHGVGLKLGYSYVLRGSVLVGGSTGVVRRNNYRDLPEVEVGTEVLGTPDPDTGQVRVARGDRQIVRVGDYVEKYVWNIRTDVVFVPDALSNRYGFAVYQNTDASSAAAVRKTDVGFGFHILKAKSPAISLGSIIVEATDVFDAAKKGESLGRRLTVSLQGSVPLLTR